MYLIIKKDTNEVVKKSDAPFNADESIQPPPPLVQLKVIRDETKPGYDAANEKLVLTHKDDFKLLTRTYFFEKAVLSSEEKALITQASADETTRQQVKTVYAALKAGTGTATQRLVRIEKAVAYLLKDLVK